LSVHLASNNQIWICDYDNEAKWFSCPSICNYRSIRLRQSGIGEKPSA
jgi:hypothetical protein